MREATATSAVSFLLWWRERKRDQMKEFQFFGFSCKQLDELANAQVRLLNARVARGLPFDTRSLANLRNARSDAGHLAPGIPPESLWAYEPEGISQVGCIYTAQGFEFDYVGVIFGRDLVYNPSTAEWEGNREASEDTVVKRSSKAF